MLNRPGTVFIQTPHCHRKFHTIDDAVALFRRMLHMHPPPSVVEFTKILGAIVNMKDYAIPIYLYTQMESRGILPYTVTLNILMNCYCHLGQLGFAFSVLAKILKLGYQPSVVSLTTLIKGLCITGKVLDACTIHDNIVAKGFRSDQVMYGTLMSGLCKSKGSGNAIETLQELEALQLVKPNFVIYNTVIHGLCKDGLVNKAQKLCSEMIQRGIFPDVVTFSSLIYGFCHAGQWKDVRLLLNEKSLDVCSFNIIMDALCKQGLLLEAHAVCYEMIKRGVQPDVISYTILMDGYCLKCKVDKARKLFDMMIEAGLVPDVWSYNILIQGYCKIERVDEAMNLCEDMLTKNLVPNAVTYKYLFDGLCRFGRLPDAWNFLTRMHYRGHRPPDLTPYNIILETLCEQHLDKANKIFNSLIPEPNVQSYNILISGYCKNGRVDEAMSIYQNMCLRNIVRDSETFKLLINAFCKRKQCDKAIALYKNNRDLCPFKILMDGLRKNGMEEVAQRVSQLYGACDPDVALVRNQLAL